jgi:exopolysaccharide biosynthesis polyprenyl glycosylphosphotransferase
MIRPVLTDRREGVVYLYWCAQTFAAVATYLAWVAFISAWPTAYPLDGTKVMFYLLGVILASFSLHVGQHNSNHRLVPMGLLEAIPHTLHQLLRFVAVLVTLAVLMRDGERTYLFGYLVILTLVLTLANMYFPSIIAWFVFRDNLMPTVLVTGSDEVKALHRMMSAREHLGIELVGWVGEGALDAQDAPLPKLGNLPELSQIVRDHGVGQVLISQLSYSPDEGRAIARCAENVGCRVRFVLHVQRYFPDQPLSIEREGPFTLMSAAREPLENPLNRLLKRLLDIAIALPVVVFVLPPLFLVVWLVQRHQSPGPLLHQQQRSGLDRKRFVIYKIRTMHEAGNAPTLSAQATRHDARIYPFGRFLRRTSLDEMPQFLNVLIGNMSAIGPRPHLLEHDEQFARIVNTYYTRHFVKPGITGLAQSQGYRGEIANESLLEKRIGYDMLYIREWSFSLDLRILVRTAWQVFFPPQSAY